MFFREGYRFTGWFADITDESTRWRDKNEVTASVVLYARWTRAPDNFRVGDTCGNGRVTSADATRIARHVVGHDEYNFCKLAADINGDGEVTITDITLLLRWLVGHNVSHLIA
jgi:uncharacterized repeat protein (TIGR02543 family)